MKFRIFSNMNFISSHYRMIVISFDRYCVKTINIDGKKLFKNIPLSITEPSRNVVKRYGFSMVTAFSFIEVLESVGFKKEKNYEIKTLLREANNFLEEGRQKEAEELYKKALKIAADNQDVADIFVIKTKLAAIAFYMKKYKEAETLFMEIKKHLIGNGVKSNDLQLLYVNLRLAEIYDGLQNYEKAEEFYSSCEQNANLKNASVDAVDDEFIEFWLMFLTSEAHHYLNRGNFDKAHKYFVKAYDISLKTKGIMTEQTVKLLQQLGSVCFQKGELETAIVYLKRAIELGKHLPGMVDLSNAYISLGNIYLKQGLIKDAEILCKQGYKNAVRHKYEQGINESNSCIKELEEIMSVPAE